MTHRAKSTLAAAALLVATACGARSAGSVSLGRAPVVRTSTTVAGSVATTTPEPASDALSGFQSDPFRREHTVSVPPLATVVGIRTAAHDGYDRVVFDFSGSLPAAESVRYTTAVVADGSGAPVAVAGHAYLLVTFEEAQAHTDAGTATIAARSKPAGLATVDEIVAAGDYEGYVTAALGLSAKVPFRVLELANPTRIVVDVRSAS